MPKPRKLKRKEEKGQVSQRHDTTRYFVIGSLKSDSGALTLITPDAEYTIAGGRVVRVEPVLDYDLRVREEIGDLARRALVADGLLSGEYRIQFNRTPPIISPNSAP